MADSSSHRALKTLLTVLALGVAGCQTGSDPMGVYGGRVQFQISNGAGVATSGIALSPSASGDDDDDRERERNPFFQSANVTFSSILARDTDGVLVNVEMELPTTVDVVALEEGGRTVSLPDGDLPPATYDQIVVVMTNVEGVLYDGTTIAITPPGGGWTAVVPVCPFDVAEDATAVVGLMLPVRTAFAWRDGRFRFEPRFRSRVRCEEPVPETDTDSDTA